MGGGTYMLDMKIDEIVVENGKFTGVRSGNEVAKAASVIGDPSYFPNLVKKTGQVVRCICILDHPIASGIKQADSTQIIIPQKQVGRNSDIYIHLFLLLIWLYQKDIILLLLVQQLKLLIQNKNV